MVLQSRKAEIGVGVLIVFIALILVAAVAAGLVLQTVFSLEEQSVKTGSQTESQIGTHADYIEISAIDGTTGQLNNFTLSMKLSPGSDSINLGNAIITFNSQNTTTTYLFRKRKNDSSYCDEGPLPNNCQTVDIANQNGTFTVEYLHQDDNWKDGMFQDGDLVRLFIDAPRVMDADEEIRINFIPKIGAPTLAKFTTPLVVTEERLFLYPVET